MSLFTFLVIYIVVTIAINLLAYNIDSIPLAIISGLMFVLLFIFMIFYFIRDKFPWLMSLTGFDIFCFICQIIFIVIFGGIFLFICGFIGSVIGKVLR